MSKKLIITILLAAILVPAGYFLFKWSRGSAAAWKYIPSNAIVVITSEHLQDSVYQATDAKLDLKRLPFLDIASDNLSLLNLLLPDVQKLNKFLKGKNISYSYHPRTNTEWAVVMYIPVDEDQDVKWLNSPQHNAIRVLHHTFQDNRITDINDTKSQPLFSYVIKDNFLILSYYGDLIEDVVRTSSLSISRADLQSKFAKSDDSNYGTSIYLKNEAWKSVIPTTNHGSNFSEFVQAFPNYQDYHAENKDTDNKLQLVSNGTDSPGYYITNWLKDNSGLPFKGHKHISQQTSYFYRFAVKEKAEFQKQFLKWHKKQKSEAWQKLVYHVGKESTLLLENLGSELILCQLEENNSISDGKILLAEFSNYDKLRPVLKKLAQLSTPESNVSTDQFQGYDIYSVAIPELPAGIYGSMFSGFPRTYVTYIAPYLVMSNNSQVLQNYIVDYENQLTWKQSPEYDSVLTSTKFDAQLSLVVNLRKAQSRGEGLNTKSYTDLSAKIESVVLQCRYDGSDAYPEITLNPKKRQTANKVLNRTFLNIDIEWPVLYDTELTALQNPIDGTSEVLLTDQENNLLRVNNLKTGKTETITKLNGPIVTSAYKVDFLNIGRQQRIFATSSSVYAIDEDDSTHVITSFSKGIPSASAITALYMIDGGEDGSNRFIVSDEMGELYVWESVMKNIRKLNVANRFDNIQSPVISLNQIGNRNYIITQKNGKIFLLKSNGAVREGFPVDILARTESPFTWTQNPSTGQSELVGVSVYGELIRISMDGKIKSQTQLLRPEPASQFKTVFDRNSLDWILVRSSANKAAFLTKDGVELFEIKNLLPNSVIQYHFFGVDNRFITIRSGNYTTIFDMTGKRLGDKPIPSELKVQLTYLPSYYKLLIFSRSEKKVQVWSIKLR
ncbi:hypothetical protein SAMN04487995_1730 [Dyadobacter koreensis]|uniref:Uncharacterized protein n=1 Tax=Dyadobacter koreensis TaxID=408657 RepID=A0A1H6SH56_9BACT|nr:hypothetical protein [Dyadobacter koreensis]SEI62762.1 hypothetical protein SAMN04487995_1730 [Dyadobacter koreensis]